LPLPSGQETLRVATLMMGTAARLARSSVRGVQPGLKLLVIEAFRFAFPLQP